MNDSLERERAEERFGTVFSHLPAVVAYARRRGSRDAEAIAAEAMTIAWRRLADVPVDDPRPWLYATARNLLLAEARNASPLTSRGEAPDVPAPAQEPFELHPALGSALRRLSSLDCEALLLTAWEDLTPTQAARTLGINPTAFRVRLLRGRRRLRALLSDLPGDGATPDTVSHLTMERT